MFCKDDENHEEENFKCPKRKLNIHFKDIIEIRNDIELSLDGSSMVLSGDIYYRIGDSEYKLDNLYNYVKEGKLIPEDTKEALYKLLEKDIDNSVSIWDFNRNDPEFSYTIDYSVNDDILLLSHILYLTPSSYLEIFSNKTSINDINLVIKEYYNFNIIGANNISRFLGAKDNKEVEEKLIKISEILRETLNSREKALVKMGEVCLTISKEKDEECKKLLDQ